MTLKVSTWPWSALPVIFLHFLTDSCIQGDVLPLFGGTSAREGLVEVCTGQGFFPVDLNAFTIHEAAVLCRELGLGSGKSLLATVDWTLIACATHP